MRKLPFLRSLRAAVLMSVLALLPLFAAGRDPVMAVSILTMSVTLTPALLSMTLVWAGLLPALVVLAAAVLGAWLPLGTGAGLLMLLFLLPPFAAFIICVANDVPFR